MRRKIRHIRELRNMKQEVLAMERGISQQTVSHMEQSESIEEEKFAKVAKALGVTPEARQIVIEKVQQVFVAGYPFHCYR